MGNHIRPPSCPASEYLVSGSHRKLSDNYTVLMQPAQLGARRPRNALSSEPTSSCSSSSGGEERERDIPRVFLGRGGGASFFFSQRAESDITLRLISSAPSVQEGKTSRNLWHSEFPADFYPDGADFFFFPQRGREKATACRNACLKQLRCGNAVTRCGRGLGDVYRHRGKWRN